MTRFIIDEVSDWPPELPADWRLAMADPSVPKPSFKAALLGSVWDKRMPEPRGALVTDNDAELVPAERWTDMPTEQLERFAIAGRRFGKPAMIQRLADAMAGGKARR